MMASASARPAPSHSVSSSSRLRYTGANENGPHDLESGDSAQELEPNRTTTTNTQTSSKRHVRAARVNKALSAGAHRKRIERIPFLRAPVSGKGTKWVREEDVATEWLNLFYDLVVVAVLTVFSTTHEIRTPYAIFVFFSYFTLIHWVWTSETGYDIQFQANDVYHRIMKSFQVAVFVYIGVGSGKWNPAYVVDPSTVPGISEEDSVRNQQAIVSFTTVASAYAASRGLMTIQYSVCLFQAHRAKRPMKSILIYVVSTLIACIFTIIAATIPATHSSNAKLGLLYSSIVVEILSLRVLYYLRQHGNIDSADVAERYGALTLIILGEGFISVIRAMNDVISGLNVDIETTYGQLVCAVFILGMLWHVLFSRFDKEDRVSSLRALLWEGVHFPLHFSMLLLLAAIVNTIINLSMYSGVEEVVNLVQAALSSLQNGTSPSPELQAQVSELLFKLELYPTYEVEYGILKNLTENPNPGVDPVIVGYQYFGQVLVATFESYGIELQSTSEEQYGDLYAINTSAIAPGLEDRRNDAGNLLLEISTSISESSLSGETWLFPAAGSVLICSAIRSFIWYRYDGIGHWIVHIIQFVTGIILCLLSLLDIGPNIVNVQDQGDILRGAAPIYRLLDSHTPLVIVVCAFAGMYLGTYLVLEIVHRTRGGIFEERSKTGESKESGVGEGQGEENGRGGHSPPNVPEEHAMEERNAEKNRFASRL